MITDKQVEAALSKLLNEIEPILRQCETTMRPVVGNTNFAVLKLRVEEGRAALAAAAEVGERKEPYDPCDNTADDLVRRGDIIKALRRIEAEHEDLALYGESEHARRRESMANAFKQAGYAVAFMPKCAAAEVGNEHGVGEGWNLAIKFVHRLLDETADGKGPLWHDQDGEPRTANDVLDHLPEAIRIMRYPGPAPPTKDRADG